MRSALLTDVHTIELVDRSAPQLAEHEVRIEVEQCGLCTSELDLWSGRDADKLPAAIGHEIAGVVSEAGRAVSQVEVGQRIAAWVTGGGFADQAVALDEHCVPVDPGGAYPAGAEPLACVVNAVELTAPKLGDDVVIIGAGYMGNLLQLVSELKGPRSIIVADVRADALERASRLGATHVVDVVNDSLADVVREVTGGRGADVSYEVPGGNPGLVAAGEVTRMSGKVCVVGYHQGGMRELPLGHWNWMAYEIVNAHFRDIDTIMAGMRAGMRLVNAGVLDPTPLISDRFALGDLAEAFRMAEDKPEGFVKAVVERSR